MNNYQRVECLPVTQNFVQWSVKKTNKLWAESKIRHAMQDKTENSFQNISIFPNKIISLMEVDSDRQKKVYSIYTQKGKLTWKKYFEMWNTFGVQVT